MQGAEQLINKMVDVFLERNTQQLSSGRGSGKFAALCPIVLDACLSKSISGINHPFLKKEAPVKNGLQS